MAKGKDLDQIEKAMDKADSLVNSAQKENPTLPKWVCRVDGAPQDGQWTVGEVFHLECEGTRVQFGSTDIKFKLSEKQDYALNVLAVDKQTENSISLKATSYRPGNHNLEDVQVVESGVGKFVMEPIQLQVKSIIKDPKQKPFGPILAMKLAYPIWLWVILGLVVLGLAFWGVFRFRRNAQMKKVIEELKQHNTALGSFNQFHKDLRTLRRKNIYTDKWPVEKKERYIESLDEIVRMYILREFYIPALDWNTNLIVKEISRSDKRRFSHYGSSLKKLLNELDRAKSDIEKVQVHGCEQLTLMAVKVSQEVWQKRKL